ncbi:NHLP bacteriocin system secretion protein [Labrys wisconsinensis]|uniref:HlyD family secretion protein n=1 Tax=Labrys wisconsinensis TaxID=425677 RepID=A0ABU0JBF7_9HYPH|nr:NHLP bacteriocin system secretion protein [Labrys wisconsinensis]MDQ0471604.1 HlyD family secretion protein [Labrys wisconsinensis]
MATVPERIYRKAAIERLSSPEQLDELVSLTSPLGWIAALALAALVASGFAWSVFGRVPTTVDGAGILVSRGGYVFDAIAPATGTLASVAAIGAIVRKGDPLASFDDGALRQDIDHAEEVLREKQADLAKLSANYDQQVALKHKNVAAQSENLGSLAAAAEQRQAFYKDLLERQAQAVARGYLTERFQEDTRRAMEEAAQAAGQARTDVLRLNAEESDLSGQRDLATLNAQQAVNEARRRVDDLSAQLQRATRVVSPLDGVVTELKATPGTIVASGKPILSLEIAGTGLELLLYVPPAFGKTVAPGMEVHIEPSTVKKEEYGTLLGTVTAVSNFPMTAEGMASVLQNAQLVANFMAQGPPYAVRVELLAVADTPSGYRWSGGPGPPTRLSSGTTVRAAVTISRQAPIEALMPMFRNRP